MKLRLTRASTRVRVILSLAAALAACGDIQTMTPVLWEANLLPVGSSVVNGNVAMVAQGGRTQIGITIRDADPGARLRWTVRQGGCSGSGAAVAPATAFPIVEANDAGNGEAETLLARALTAAVPYAAEVFASETSSEIVACADLID